MSNCDLIDSDMERIVEYIIKEEKTKILDLSGNRITQTGVSVISKAIQNDTVREKYIHRWM